MSSSISNRIIAHIVLILVVAIILFPIYWMAVASFKTNDEIFTMKLQLLPRKLNWQNYMDLFTKTSFSWWLANSGLVSVTTTLLALLFSSLGGFAFAKYDFFGKNVLFILVLGLVTVPRAITIIPVFALLSRLGLTNTYWGLILPFAVNPYAVFLMRQYIKSIPDELLDSARIDGCTEQRLFFGIILPLLKPAFGAAGIYIFMMTWNDYLFPLIMMSDDTMMLFPVGLASLKSLYVVEYGMIMAGSVLSTLPVIIMFVLLQRQFVSGLVQGAVKQ